MSGPGAEGAGAGGSGDPQPPADARLYGLLDPVVETLRGALPYHDMPAALPDDQPPPSLRARRLVGAPGLRVAIEWYGGDQHLAGEELDVDRLPIDRATARARRRVHPAPTSVLRLVGPSPSHTDAGVDPIPAAPVGLSGIDETRVGDQRVVLPAHGPGPQDVQAVLVAVRRHRLVTVDDPGSSDPVLLAGLVLQVVAAGTACWCPPEVASRLDLLDPRLRSELGFDLAAAAEDDLLLASRVAVQKRAAWTAHDLRLAWVAGGDDAWRPRLQPVSWPAVSIVLVSRRPALLPMALEMIAAQRGVELEVIVALHGGGDVASVDALRRASGLSGRVLSVPSTVPFGAVLNQTIVHTTGRVVLKWDDDDLYGPHHVQDLLVARRQSGAALVGKAAEFVYLDGPGRSVWRAVARAEGPSMGIAGGTFLADRAALDEVGGYPDVGRAVDHHLKVRLRDRGMPPFRTHGFGFVLRRHALGHTWEASDERFRGRAVRSFDGLPDVLQLGDAARFTALPGT